MSDSSSSLGELLPAGALEVLVRYEAAFNANDAGGMAALFTENSTFVNFSGRLVIGRAELYRAQARVFAPGGPLASVEVAYTTEHAESLDEDHAVIYARQRTKGVGGTHHADDPMEAVLTLLLIRTGTGWRIRLGQNTPASG